MLRQPTSAVGDRLCRAFAGLGIVLVLLATEPAADGAIETQSSVASVRFSQANIPLALSGGDFTVFVWIRPSLNPGIPRGILQIPGLLSLQLDAANGVLASITKSAIPVTVSVTPDQRLVPGEWALVAVSFRRADGRFFVFAERELSPLKTASIVVPSLVNSSAGPATGELAIGYHPTGLLAVEGLYGPIVVRNHWIDEGDFDAVWSSRRIWAAFDTNNTGHDGHMNGPAGCAWMVNHAMTTLPQDWGVGGLIFDRAAVVGQTVGTQNFHVYLPSGPTIGPLNAVRPVTAAFQFVYRSHRDPPFSGFFGVDLPGSGTPTAPVPCILPRTRQLVTGPRGLLRVMTSAHSRAIGGTDGSWFAPSNYAHGFIELNRSKVAGIMLRPALLSGGGGTWFGFDLQLGLPPQSAEGTVVQFSANDAGPIGDFARFWTGSGYANTRGPGQGVFLRPDAFYSMRCKPESGTLVLATAPLTVRAHVLMFPGSSSVSWRSDKGTSQQVTGTQGPPSITPLDTTTWVRVMGAGDAVESAFVIVLAGDHAKDVHVGDACFVASGQGANSISVVSSVKPIGAQTRVTFSHPLFAVPGKGSTLRFGPWGYTHIDYAWPGLSPSDPEQFRGLELRALQDGAGVVAFAYSAWRPGVDGFVFGTAGWGGNGYGVQLANSFPGSHAAWMAQTEADVWIQAVAQQNSVPTAMVSYLQQLRAALPATEVVWASDVQHETGYPTFGIDPWDRFIFEHAAENGVAGILALEQPQVGDFREQLANGMRMDGAHLSQRGNVVVARVWTELLKRAAVDPCLRADLNFDGRLDLADFGAFQTLFANGDPLADVNGDGVLNLADFGAFQTVFALGC
jgi:hypothetical protein